MKTPVLPEWFSQPVDNPPGPKPREGRRFGLPIRKTLAELAEALAREMSSPSQTNSWLGKIEPRAKIVGILMLIFGATLVHGLGAQMVLLGITLAAALSIGLSPRQLGRLWLGVPLFSLAIILPSTLNLVTDGRTALTLWHLGAGIHIGSWNLPEAITITASGLLSAGRFLLRTTNCITLAFLMVSSTDAPVLVNAFRRLGMPKAFGMILTMTQRFLVVLLRAAEEIHLAKLSRSIGGSSLRSEQKWVGAGIAILFRRSYRLGLEVNYAMVSRGYDGDLRVASVPGLQIRDGLWVAAAGGLIALLIVWERFG